MLWVGSQAAMTPGGGLRGQPLRQAEVLPPTQAPPFLSGIALALRCTSCAFCRAGHPRLPRLGRAVPPAVTDPTHPELGTPGNCHFFSPRMSPALGRGWLCPAPEGDPMSPGDGIEQYFLPKLKTCFPWSEPGLFEKE